MTVDMNFQERFPESTVSTKELEERAKKLSEEIRVAEENCFLTPMNFSRDEIGKLCRKK